MEKQYFIYKLDASDIIVSVSENWAAFAEENNWDNSLSPENVVGQKIWYFIQDRETRYLYQELFKQAREGRTFHPIPFRCDSPDKRRFMNLEIRPLTNGELEITSIIMRTEPRTTVRLLDINSPHSNQLVKVCSMCKKMETDNGKWEEIEDGIDKLGLFESEKPPRLSHGVCLSCHQIAFGAIDKTE